MEVLVGANHRHFRQLTIPLFKPIKCLHFKALFIICNVLVSNQIAAGKLIPWPQISPGIPAHWRTSWWLWGEAPLKVIISVLSHSAQGKWRWVGYKTTVLICVWRESGERDPHTPLACAPNSTSSPVFLLESAPTSWWQLSPTWCTQLGRDDRWKWRGSCREHCRGHPEWLRLEGRLCPVPTPAPITQQAGSQGGDPRLSVGTLWEAKEAQNVLRDLSGSQVSKWNTDATLL